MFHSLILTLVTLTLNTLGCTGSYNCSSENSLRLYNQYGNTCTQGGMLQVCKSGIWTAVCDTFFYCHEEGQAACKELGYGGSKLRVVAIHNSSQYFGSWNYTTNYYYSCSSSSPSLTSCVTYSEPSFYHCNSERHVGLWCLTFPPNVSQCTHESVRLVGGQSSREGRLEYCYYGVWSPVGHLQITDATVACKQLGFTNSPKAAIIGDGRFGRVSNYSLFRSFYCSYPASKTNLTSCSLYDQCGIGPSHGYGIVCYESEHDGCTDGAVRLVNSTIEHEGRVEVCADGVWGTVCGGCSDYGCYFYYSNYHCTVWQNTACRLHGFANGYVICKSLGYRGIPIYYTSSQFGDGGRPFLYLFDCNGYEENISLCSNYSYLSFSCPWNAALGVRCRHGCTDGDVRLTGGSNATEGTVEVCSDSTWGMVSGLGWGEEDARVVCRQLQFQAEGSMSYSDSPFGKPNLTVHYSSVQCTGNETRLINCATNKLTFEEGKQLVEHIGVAGVSCNTNYPLPTPLVCPTTQYRTIPYATVTIVQAVTDCKVSVSPQFSQTPQSTPVNERWYAPMTVILSGLSGIISTGIVALGVSLCYSRKMKGRRTSASVPNSVSSSSSHDGITTPVTLKLNDAYDQTAATNPPHSCMHKGKEDHDYEEIIL